MRGLIVIIAVLLLATPAAAQDIPHLERRGEATQLIVDGKPFLILGGELGNSSASRREYMQSRWAKLKAMNLNTVLAPVYWELVEPEEGRLDFASVDWLLEGARANDMRLVLLWFGAWKNSMSSYAPRWVKCDTRRFPRTAGAEGKPQEIISAFSANARDADARAFGALMRHLREVDGFADPVSIADTFDAIPVVTELGPAVITVTTIDPWTPREAQDTSTHGAVLIWLGGEDYLVAGQGVTFTVSPLEGEGSMGFERVEEGRYENGQWIAGHRLNGDQTHQGRHVRLPSGEYGVQRFRLYRY